jgi:hypothetical protein
MDQPGQVGDAVPAAAPDRHFEGVEDQGGLHAPRGAPARIRLEYTSITNAA